MKPLPVRPIIALSLLIGTAALLSTVVLGHAVSQTFGLANGYLLTACLAIIGTGIAAVPLAKSLRLSRAARENWKAGEFVAARSVAKEARDSGLLSIGLGSFVSGLCAILIFIYAGDGGVQKTFFDLGLIRKSVGTIFSALLVNIYIAIAAQISSMFFGLILAVLRSLPGPGLAMIRILAISYIDIFRALPAIVTIYLVCFGLPLTELPIISKGSVTLYAIIALTLTFSAYYAELFRSGIESVHKSQTAAALSLGLDSAVVFRKVVLPQAIRNITPTLLSYFIAMQKDTALVQIVGIVDAFGQAKIYSSQYYNLSSVTVVCLLFIAITIPQTRFVDWLLKRNDTRRSR